MPDITKVRREEIVPEEAVPMSTDRKMQLVSAGVAATPFLGLIGQAPIVHDPALNPKIKRVSFRELSRLARPGDIVVSGRDNWNIFRAAQTPTTGTDIYHASPIYGRRGGYATTVEAGGVYDKIRGTKSTKKLINKIAPTLQSAMYSDDYSKAVLLRPESGMSPKQIRAFQQALVQRAPQDYGFPRALKSFAKDLFIPKINFGGKMSPGDLPGMVCDSKKQMCSSIGSESFAQAKAMSRLFNNNAKSPKDILPADFLRAGSGFKPVAAVVPENVLFDTPGKALAGRLGSRALIGAGLGGATYLTYKEPEIPLAIGGGVAATALARHLIEQQTVRQLLKDKDFIGSSDKNISRVRRAMETAVRKAQKAERSRTMTPSQVRNLKATAKRKTDIWDKFIKQEARDYATDYVVPQTKFPTTKGLFEALQAQRVGRTYNVKDIVRKYLTRTAPVALAGTVGTYALARSIRSAMEERKQRAEGRDLEEVNRNRK